MIQTLPISKVREHLPSLIDNVDKKLDEYIVTVNGSPAAVILSHAEYESWNETLEILSNPSLIKSIKRGEGDVQKNNLTLLEEI